MIFDALIQRIISTQNPTCVGLDTAFCYLPEKMQSAAGSSGKERAAAVLAFNRGIIDSVCDIVPAVKVQIAYYEPLGAEGIACFAQTCRYAKERGLFVIVDAKRNDIGATASQYATAFLAGENFPCDFLTVNGYLGTDGILPFLERAKAQDRGLFVLVKTSNPSSGELQDLVLRDGRTVFECMGDMVEHWGEGSCGEYGFSRVGAVVGATYPEEGAALRKRLSHIFFLIPGYGAQGGNARMLRSCFTQGGLGGIVNNSRGILCAHQKRGGAFEEAARAAAVEMREDLHTVLGEICARS